MSRLPDISEWYTPARAYEEEVQWILGRQYRRNLEFVVPKIKEYQVKSVVEWGCGTGLVALGLPEEVGYVGIDKNELFLKMAAQKCPKRKFVLGDIRDPNNPVPYGLSTAWAFMKHFSLEEWDHILLKVLSSGKHAAFNLSILDHELDNGTQYHHVYVTEDRLKRVIAEAGHEEKHRDVFWQGAIEGHGETKEIAVWTSLVGDKHG